MKTALLMVERLQQRNWRHVKNTLPTEVNLIIIRGVFRKYAEGAIETISIAASLIIFHLRNA